MALPEFGQPIARQPAGGVSNFDDNIKLFFGDDDDSSLVYDGTDIIINPKEVGAGVLRVMGDVALGGGGLLEVGNVDSQWIADNFTMKSALDQLVTLETTATDKFVLMQMVLGASSTLLAGLRVAQGSGDGSENNMSYDVIYDANAGKMILFSQDIDGVSTNGNVWEVLDGTDDFKIVSGNLLMNAAGSILDVAAAGNDWTATLLSLQNSANIKIGAVTARDTTEPTNALTLFNGTVPVGTLANGVTFYSKDVTASAEAHVMDESGNETLLSPHDPETGEWIFYSRHSVSGRVLRVRMERMVKRLEDEFGWGFVEEFFE